MSKTDIARVTVKHGEPRTRGSTDWKRIDAMTDEETTANARDDPDAQPLSEERLAKMRRVSRVKVLRQRLGMTQVEFAAAFHLPISTLRDWEQHQSNPDAPARALLLAIERDPERMRQLSGQALLVQGHDNIANANEITQQIAALKSRLAALDRERSEIAERLSALEHVRAVDAARQRFPVFARVTMSSPTADKLHSFGAFFAEGTMCFRTDGRIPRAARRVIRPCVGTSGFEGSAGNLKLSAGNAQTKHSFRSMRILSALISQEECQGVRGISRPACIPCYPTRLVGFWSPILTRRHGGGTLARSVILPDQTESQLPSNNPARGMVWAYLSTVAPLVTNRVARFARLFDAPRQMPLPNAG